VSADRFACTELDGGLLVLSEELPELRSVSVGVWVRSGSAHEAPSELGASHLVEHMVFKGTRRRSAREIALSLERYGGALDAYTSREHTSYQARVLAEHGELALDVLADMVSSPLLREEDLALEREVVLEEISTVEDTPDDLIFDLHAEALWGDHPYGTPILGRRETVARLGAEDLRRVHRRGYGRANLIVAAVGNIRHETLVDWVEAAFVGVADGGRPSPLPGPPRTLVGDTLHVTRPTAQTHLVLGTGIFGHRDPRRYALVLLSNALGGAMSSRLFQRVREELGLAYTVFSFQSFCAEAGVAGVYVGTRPEWADHAESVLREELALVARDGLSAAELEDAKGQVKGQLLLSLESSGARLQRLAGFALFDEPFLTLDELAARVDAVTLDEVAGVAAEYFDPGRQLALRLGPDR